MVDYDSFEQFRDAETYDLQCDDFDDDYALMEQWAHKLGSPLLDLGCGTGRMAIHLAAQGYAVTSVDVIPEMIEWGRLKAAERAVSLEWVVADARVFALDKQFPFIFMLSHAFQFLLTRADHEAMLACVREHLHPDGYFLFDTYNPSPQNLYEVRHPDAETFALPGGGKLVTTEQQDYDPLTQIQHYTRHLTFHHPEGHQEEKTLHTAFRYVFPQEMEALLHYNGFEIDTCYGNWQGNTLEADSPLMIYVCRKAA
jgi:2-polyprenyl-3-methyl-5-hydroxy-6-metoxy-1,4-benzoquinol methylase